MDNTTEFIYGEKVYIRPMTVNDTEDVVRWRNSDNVMKNFFYRIPITPEGHIKWLTDRTENKQLADFVVCLKETDTPVGCVYLQNFDWEKKVAEEGIFLGDEAPTRQGIALEAAKLIQKYAFETLKLEKLEARVMAQNPASLRLHEAAGYNRVGTSMEKIIPDGTEKETIWFEIKKNNFEL